MKERYLAFEVAGREYAVEAARIREVTRLGRTTRVPNAAGYLRGVMNLRGRILPVLDLRTRLGATDPEDENTTPVVVVERGSVVAGMIVDQVSGMIDVAADAMQPQAAEGDDAARRPDRGGVEVGERSILLLDLEVILGDDALRPESDPRDRSTPPLASPQGREGPAETTHDCIDDTSD